MYPCIVLLATMFCYSIGCFNMASERPRSPRVNWETGKARSKGFLEDRLPARRSQIMDCMVSQYQTRPIVQYFLESPSNMKISVRRLMIMMNTWRTKLACEGSKCSLVLGAAIRNEIFKDDKHRNTFVIQAMYTDHKIGQFLYDADLDNCYFRMG